MGNAVLVSETHIIDGGPLFSTDNYSWMGLKLFNRVSLEVLN
jgi:hypothetical protein